MKSKTNWNEGPQFTEVVSDEPVALVVRERTPGTPGRFMRLRVELPAP